ncbi:pre- rRNA processing protein, partial [Cladochytrium tenue]
MAAKAAKAKKAAEEREARRRATEHRRRGSEAAPAATPASSPQSPAATAASPQAPPPPPPTSPIGAMAATNTPSTIPRLATAREQQQQQQGTLSSATPPSLQPQTMPRMQYPAVAAAASVGTKTRGISDSNDRLGSNGGRPAGGGSSGSGVPVTLSSASTSETSTTRHDSQHTSTQLPEGSSPATTLRRPATAVLTTTTTTTTGKDPAAAAVVAAAPPSFISSLQLEVQLLMRLDHPHIIQLYQVVETDTECYVIMEFAGGGDLIEYIASRDYLTEKEARRLFRQIVSAMDHCHLANVVHRDLKLENLLLSDKRDILISDFGLGRTVDPTSGEFLK